MITWLICVPGFLAVTTFFWQILQGGELQGVLLSAIAICVVLMMALLYRPTRWYAAALTLGLPLALVVLLRPVCTPVDGLLLKTMNPPIEARTDRDIYMDVFQRMADGSWKQCHTQLERWMAD